MFGLQLSKNAYVALGGAVPPIDLVLKSEGESQINVNANTRINLRYVQESKSSGQSMMSCIQRFERCFQTDTSGTNNSFARLSSCRKSEKDL